MLKLFLAIAIAVVPALDAQAHDSRAFAAIAVAISRVHVAQARPVLPNDFDSRSRSTPTPLPQTDEVDHHPTHGDAELIAEMSDLQHERDQLATENKELSSAVLSLANELIDLKRTKSALHPTSFGELKLDLHRPSTASAVAADPYDVTVYTATWCGPCESAKRRDGNGNESIRLTWLNATPPAGIPEQYPTYCWRDATGTLRYVQGVQTLARLQILIERNDPPRQRAELAAASAVGGTIKTGSRIKTALSTWSDRLGPDAAVTIRWDRSGLQTLSATKLMHGETWTPHMVCGSFGHVAVSTTSIRLPGALREVGFTYRMLDESRLSLDADPIVFALKTTDAAATNSVASASHEAISIDPVSVGLTVAQVATALYQLLNPQIDVGLGGTVACTAKLDGPETLSITFTECPSIHVSAWFHFDLEVERVVISRTNVHVAFKPQPRNWLRVESRDFPVDDE